MDHPALRDARYAIRTLRREPAFVIGVVLTFALAIGMNAAMLGLVTRLMLAAPEGIAAADRVAHVALRVTDDDGEPFFATTSSFPMFRSLERATTAFSSVAAVRSDTVLVGRSPDVSQVAVLGASGSFFATLGATPYIGRFFDRSDDAPPAGSSVIVLGYAYWQRAFNSERSVLGRHVVIDDQPFTIVGVARAGFNGDAASTVDAFIPVTASMRKSGPVWLTNRDMNVVSIIVRVRDGLSLAAAAQIGGGFVGDELSLSGRSRGSGMQLRSLVPGAEAHQSPRGRIALWLTAVSAIVLLIATANVGTLFSLRAARRNREIAVRVAMGARGVDLARQLLAESLLLAGAGAAFGLLLSRWLGAIVRVTLLPGLAPGESFVDRPALIASLAAALVSGLLAGLIPLRQTRSRELSTRLRAGSSGLSPRLALQQTLITVQVALCMLLVIGAALFVHSLERVQAQDLGFSTEKLLFATLEFRGYAPGGARDVAYDEALERTRAVRGVSTATVVAGIPFGPHNIPPVSVPGIQWSHSIQQPIMYAATPDYLAMMDVRRSSGRLFTASDRRQTAHVVLVNETMARITWPGQSPLGKCVRVGFGALPPSVDGNPADAAPCREVVGVVHDSRARSLLPDQGEDRLMQYYVPFEQMPDAPIPDQAHAMGLLVRVSDDIDGAAAHVQRAIQSSSAVRVYARVRPYQDLIDPQLRSWRLGATLFSAFGILALGIAAVGLFGVVSFAAAQRTREIGIRLAIGGSTGVVARLVVGDALRTVGFGLGIGIVAALLAGPLVAAMLFQTSPREPASIGAATTVLLLATLAAAALPAWRAGRVSPAVALRAE